MTAPRSRLLGFLVVCCLGFWPGLALAWSAPDGGPAVRPVQYPSPGQAYDLFNNNNIDAVQNGPRNPTVFSLDGPYTVTHIQTYHYFNYGRPPGYISLRGRDGSRYGPWPTMGEPGQGGVPNAYWNCYPNITLPPGLYRVEDSDPETWSMNAASGYRGFAIIRGLPAY